MASTMGVFASYPTYSTDKVGMPSNSPHLLLLHHHLLLLLLLLILLYRLILLLLYHHLILLLLQVALYTLAADQVLGTFVLLIIIFSVTDERNMNLSGSLVLLTPSLSSSPTLSSSSPTSSRCPSPLGSASPPSTSGEAKVYSVLFCHFLFPLQ